MLESEYQKRLAAKAAALEVFATRKQAARRRIADAILSDPDEAISWAMQALHNKTASWQAWSRDAWLLILQTKSARDIVELLLHPAGNQEALADSHPFGGLPAARNGR